MRLDSNKKSQKSVSRKCNLENEGQDGNIRSPILPSLPSLSLSLTGLITDESSEWVCGRMDEETKEQATKLDMVDHVCKDRDQIDSLSHSLFS